VVDKFWRNEVDERRIGNSKVRKGKGRNWSILTFIDHILSLALWRATVDERFSVLRNKSVEVDHRSDTVGDACERAGGYHAPVAVTDESHILKTLHLNVSNDIFDMG
jgi:hypothetical protein